MVVAGAIMGPYTTTYGREYREVKPADLKVERPKSTGGYMPSARTVAPPPNTTYDAEFSSPPHQERQTPIRTGTASGNRRNNPHPLETFMNWKFSADAEGAGHKRLREVLTEELLDRICRDQIASTYQQDYTGRKQGSRPTLQPRLPPECVAIDRRQEVPYSLDSSSRSAYQRPRLQPELRGNTVRYGCNKSKHVPAQGVVPTVIRCQPPAHTSYQMSYMGAPPQPPVSLEARDYLEAATAAKVNAISDKHCCRRTIMPEEREATCERGKPSSPILPMLTHSQRDDEAEDALYNDLIEALPSSADNAAGPPARGDCTGANFALPALSRRRHGAENKVATSQLYPRRMQILRADLNTLQAGATRLPRVQ